MILTVLNVIRSAVMFVLFFTASLLPQPTHIEGVVGQPTGFTPLLATNDIDRCVNKLVYRSLFTYDSDGKIVPDLVEHYEVSDDGLTYIIRLKANERWQDGKLITSNDILYTVASYKRLSGIATDRLDNRTIRFTLPNKFSPFLDLLTVGLLPDHKGDSNNRWFPVGSGSYRVIRVSRDRGRVKNIVLEGNSPRLGVTRIIFKFYDSEADLETAARLGEVTGFYEKNDSFVYKNFSKYTRPEQNRYYALFYNLRKDSLKDVNVRSWLASKLPASEILKKVFGDGYVLATGPLSLNNYARGDIKYLEASGANNKPTNLNFVIVDNDNNRELAALIKEAWEEAGVKVTVAAYDADKMNKEILPSRDFDVLLYGQEVSYDPDRYVLWHTTQGNFPGLNISGLSNARVDKALEEGRKEYSFEDRYKHYSIFQKAIMDEVPAVFLYHPIFNYYLRSNITGVDLKNFALPDDRFNSISNWAFN